MDPYGRELNLLLMKSRWLLLSLLVVGLSSCDGIKTKLAGLMKESVPEVKPAAATAGAAPDAPAANPPVVVKGGENVRQLSGTEFQSFIATSGQLVVVDFYADWCGPCRQLGPALEALVGEYNGKVLLGKVNVDQNTDLAGQQQVRSIPDVRFYKNGKEVDRFAGAMPAHLIREKIDKHLADLSEPPPAPTPPIQVPIQEVAKTPEKTPDPLKVAPDPVAPPPPVQPKPLTTPMSKDWMPPGIKRR